MMIENRPSSSQPPCSRDSAATAQSPRRCHRGPCCAPSVTVSGDLVRIGDVIDNAGTAAQIAIYRAPDLGTTGSLPVAPCSTRCGRIR
jgi:flagella basal body P-ring formation protein FlgA